MTKRLTFATAVDPPRVHYASVGPWLFVVRPYTVNRFGAYTHRIGWERDEEKLFRSVEAAKAHLETLARLMELGHQR